MTTIHLDYRPRAWQHRCHMDRKRFTVLALHRRAGKTELALMELLDAALRFTKPLGLFVYIAPLLKQAKQIAWTRLKARVEQLRLAGAVEVREAELSVVFLHNHATLSLFGADNPDALRGVRLDGVVVDEVAQVKPEVWTDVLQPALADRLGWAMFIGTPAGINLFSELFFAAKDLRDWHSALWTVYDTDALDPAEVERQRATLPENVFAREFLCDFRASGDDQLISLLDAELAAQRTYTAADVRLAPRIIGVDPARFGDDRSVICRRHGLIALPMKCYQGIDNMTLAGLVAQEIDAWRPDAVFIDAGAGAGVIDRLRQLDYSVIEVPFGGKALQPEFANRRTEMWIAMADWLRGGGQIPDDRVLKQELATPIYWFDAQNRKVLEPKDDIKKRLQGGASPDLADALALTFAAPVRAQTPIDAIRREHEAQRRPSRDYDPLDLLT